MSLREVIQMWPSLTQNPAKIRDVFQNKDISTIAALVAFYKNITHPSTERTLDCTGISWEVPEIDIPMSDLLKTGTNGIVKIRNSNHPEIRYIVYAVVAKDDVSKIAGINCQCDRDTVHVTSNFMKDKVGIYNLGFTGYLSDTFRGAHESIVPVTVDHNLTKQNSNESDAIEVMRLHLIILHALLVAKNNSSINFNLQ